MSAEFRIHMAQLAPDGSHMMVEANLPDGRYVRGQVPTNFNESAFLQSLASLPAYRDIQALRGLKALDDGVWAAAVAANTPAPDAPAPDAPATDGEPTALGVGDGASGGTAGEPAATASAAPAKKGK